MWLYSVNYWLANADLNQRLYTKTLCISKQLYKNMHASSLSILAIDTNVHCSNMRALILFYTLTMSTMKEGDYLLSYYWGLTLFCCHWQWILLLCTNCRDIWQVSASHKDWMGSDVMYLLKLLVLNGLHFMLFETFSTSPNPDILSKYSLIYEKRQNADVL